MKVEIDETKIDAILNRGVEAVYPSREALRKKLLSGEKLKIYFGIDPTGPTLHLGHVIALKKLAQFQALGHKAVLLMGDFTAMIGDPTDKAEARKQLSREEIATNQEKYKKQASAVVDFSGENPAEFKHNSKWLSGMSFEETLSVASKLTVGRLLKRDMFDKRIKAGSAIYLHEFLYPLMQGYDSVAMDVDGEVGGNDQTFNMLVGRDLLKQMKGKDKFVISMRLLTDSAGKKMGKTEGNTVSLSDHPSETFGKIMSWSDEMILPGFELCSTVPFGELENIKNELEKGENPKNLKMSLAENVVSMLHGPSEAKAALCDFSETFSSGKMPSDAVRINLPRMAGMNDFADKLVEEGAVGSKSDFRRLLSDGAVETLSGEKLSSGYIFENNVDIKIGKRRFVSVGLEK